MKEKFGAWGFPCSSQVSNVDLLPVSYFSKFFAPMVFFFLLWMLSQLLRQDWLYTKYLLSALKYSKNYTTHKVLGHRFLRHPLPFRVSPPTHSFTNHTDTACTTSQMKEHSQWKYVNTDARPFHIWENLMNMWKVALALRDFWVVRLWNMFLYDFMVQWIKVFPALLVSKMETGP